MMRIASKCRSSESSVTDQATHDDAALVSGVGGRPSCLGAECPRHLQVSLLPTEDGWSQCSLDMDWPWRGPMAAPVFSHWVDSSLFASGHRDGWPPRALLQLGDGAAATAFCAGVATLS